MQIKGTVVAVDKYDWEMNGRTGTSHYLFLKPSKAVDAPDKVRIDEADLSRFKVGDTVEVAVSIETNERGKIQIRAQEPVQLLK